ncbi:GNAT family N-acetyltransferase [candidate division KSB1 bacterium]|nr:GNAT family N-acetyltransferase [candidate division KSB1 bacterium]
MNTLSIRIIDKADYALCCFIFENQQRIWEMPAAEAMPVWKLMTLQSTGGLLIGAFDHARIVAHAMLTPAIDVATQDSFLYLDMIGVLPDYRNRKLGEQMLLVAREQARRRGYASIQWTFDPLEAANARLYIGKLGAKAVRFTPNYYGPGDAQNAAASDRFWLRWDIATPRHNMALPEMIIAPEKNFDLENIQKVERCALEIPNDFRLLCRNEPERATDIRLKTRALFLFLFQKKFVVRGFACLDSKNYYIAVIGTAASSPSSS